MSLLMNYTDEKYVAIAQLVFQEQFRRDPKLESEMDDRRKRLMYDDVVYNISFLMTAVHFHDEKIFAGYAKWIYELLCSLMKDLDRDRIMEQMISHYKIMSEILADSSSDLLSREELSLAQEYLEKAILVTRETVTDIPLSFSFQEGRHFNIRKSYLNALLTGQTANAREIIDDARNQGVTLIEIFEDVLTKAMYEIGELWHRNIITIDKEHYATSVTQTIMSSFYDEIFNSSRKNKTLVSCAIGSELHEIGIRMLSDLFEYHGWDTYYLGAALPETSVLQAITEHKPDLVALSVTMPPYLAECEKIVVSIRDKFPEVKIAVGGQAFRNTDDLWKKWEVDFHARTALELVNWADQFPR